MMRRNPERTAWIVLSGAFLAFCLLAGLIPVGARWFLDTATANAVITLNRSSTVYVQRPGRASLEANLTDIPVGATISTETNAQANLIIQTPDKRETIANITIYGDTQLTIVRADSPRFDFWSPQPHRIDINLTKGRLRAFSAAEASRPAAIRITSTPGTVTLVEARGANASVEATFVRTTVTVRDGQARVSARGQSLLLQRDQRGEVAAGASPAGPLPVERDLITDGEFRETLGQAWQPDIRPPADPAEDPGRVQQTTLDGRRAVQFQRLGQNWGQVGVIQVLNQDVRDFKSLRLQLDVQLAYQDLSNCGSQGTECPVMVKLRYVDAGGLEREWLQGFYYKYDANPVFGYTFCAPCSPRYGDHLRVEQNQWRTFETENLLDDLRQAAAPAAVLRSIAIYGSGHTFDSNVAQVQLLVSE